MRHPSKKQNENPIEVLERERQRMEIKLHQLREMISKEQSKPRPEWTSAKDTIYISSSQGYSKGAAKKAGYKGLFDAVGKKIHQESLLADYKTSNQEWRVPTALANPSAIAYEAEADVSLQINSNIIDVHGNPLLDGEYDEQQSRNSFQHALMAWRNSGNSKSSLSEEPNSNQRPITTTTSTTTELPSTNNTKVNATTSENISTNTDRLEFNANSSHVGVNSGTSTITTTNTDSDHQNKPVIYIKFKTSGLSFTQRLLLQQLRQQQQQRQQKEAQ